MKSIRIILLLLILSRRSDQCKKAVIVMKDPEQNVTEEDSDYDYDDVSATSDENHDEDDDSNDAFQDAEDEELCADVSDAPLHKALPGAVIFGTKKGGTRALLEFLNIHSQIKRAKNEVHFYDKHWARGVDWYIRQMPNISEGQLALEKTPGYFHTPGAARRIWEVKNDTKLIMIVRHPVTRLVSDYNQFRSNNLARGQTQYPNLDTFVLTEAGAVDPGYPPVVRSMYHQHMTRWLNTFPMTQIHVVDGDKFIRAPWDELRLLETFLGLEPELTEENFYFNKSKGFFCGRQEVRRRASEWSCVRRKCLSSSKGRPKPEVPESLLTKLTEFFVSHNEKFFEQVGRRFDWNTLP